jgi:hypothetical protein
MFVWLCIVVHCGAQPKSQHFARLICCAVMQKCVGEAVGGEWLWWW